LLEDVGGRVVEARVDRAEFLQGETVRGLVGVLEDVGGGLVQRDGAGAGDGIGDLAGVEGDGGEMVLGGAHCEEWSRSWREVERGVKW